MKPLIACIIVGLGNAVIIVLSIACLHIDPFIGFGLVMLGAVSFVAESRLEDL